jgi:glycosyltransferase involved in cell wall biosynthesis
MMGRSIVQVTLWKGPYLGNFMECELALARAVRATFGLGTHFVLAGGARGQPWLEEIETQGFTWSIMPRARRSWRAHLTRLARERDAALVHTHFTAADYAAAAVAAKIGFPCIWHLHTGFTRYSPKQRAKDLLKWRLIARLRVARIIAVSPWLAELARRRGAPRERIEVLPNPIVLERFAQLPGRAAARERFGLAPDAQVVLALGWWPSVKGVDVLLDALERLAPDRHAMQALLVGEQEMQSFLDERSSARPPWLRTSSFVEDAAWLFAAADVFVSASRQEGQSAAIGEAIACGVPVVMSDIPGTAGWSGAPNLQTFPVEDSAALAASLLTVLGRSQPERIRGAAENRRWASEHWGADVWCEQLCAIYAEALGSAGSSSGAARD